MLNLHIKQKVISQDIHSEAKVRCWRLEARSSMLDVGSWILELKFSVTNIKF